MFEKDQGTLILLAGVLSFLIVNFDSNLGLVYVSMLVFYYFMADDSGLLQIGIFRNKQDWVMSFIFAGGTYILLTVVTPILSTYFFPSSAGQSYQSLTAIYSQAALTGSTTIKVLSVGLLIPIIETMTLHGGILQAFGKFFKANLNDWFDPKTIFSILFVGATFALFHLTVRGVSNGPALFVSFVFAIASVILILVRKQYADAILLHIINNTASLGLFTALLGSLHFGA